MNAPNQGNTCAGPGCDRPARRSTATYCDTHYWQSRHKPELTPIKEHYVGPCVDCGGASIARRRCRNCYDKNYYNAPDAGARICDHPGCTKRVKTQGLCPSHYETKRKFGITREEADRRLQEQGGCAVCGVESPGGKHWSIDHDHACCGTQATCGKCIRGILCNRCNVMLGMALDNAETLRSAANYLEAYRGGSGSTPRSSELLTRADVPALL